MALLSSIKAFLSTPAFNYGRAVIYMALLAWLVQLVNTGNLSQDNANRLTAIVVAVAGPALASIFAPNGLRTYLFLVAGAVQGALVGFGGWSNNMWGSLGIALLGALGTSSLAASNVQKAAPNVTQPGA